jgi:EmrB/QacA subfamily drug resistance transporter
MVAGFGSLLLNLSTTTLNVALDRLLHDLHTTLAVAQWTITGYLLSLTLVLPTFRWMAERVGMRRLYIASLLGFTATSLLCAAAWSIDSLIAFRILQGAVGGLLTPIAQALTAKHATRAQMGRLLSLVAIPVLAAPLLGPLVGGVLVEALSWRSIFVINVPLGLGCAALCARFLPRDAPGEVAPSELDVVGLSLLSPGMALFIYGVSSLRHATHPASSATLLLPFAVAIALIAAFIVHARRRPDTALLDLRLLGQGTVAAALVTYVLTSVASFGGQLLLPLYYQQVRGQSPMGAGLLLAAQGFGMLITLPRVGRLTDRHDPGRLAMGGVVITVLGTMAFAFATETTSLWLLSISLVVRGAGLGAISNPVLSTVYRRLPKSEVANATTALNVVQRIGAPLGTALMAVLLGWRTAASASLSTAFAETFTACVALSALTLVPAFFLVGATSPPSSRS